MVLTYKEYVRYISEKMGVPVRVDQNSDVNEMSKLVNKFMNVVKNSPNEKTCVSGELRHNFISIYYDPQDNPRKRGEVVYRGEVRIYEQYTHEIHLDFKYLVLHELVHVIQRMNKHEESNERDFHTRLRRLLIKPTYEQIIDEHSNYFGYMLYREELNEINAWSNDAYITAYKYKKDYPEMTVQSIVKETLFDVGVNGALRNVVVDAVRNDQMVFDGVISMLIGHFSELGGQPDQLYFDKEVFELDVVKEMRKELRDILSKNISEEDVLMSIVQMMNVHMKDLLESKDIIVESFIKHLEYWFKRAQVKLGKAIQLGIDDATDSGVNKE